MQCAAVAAAAVAGNELADLGFQIILKLQVVYNT